MGYVMSCQCMCNAFLYPGLDHEFYLIWSWKIHGIVIEFYCAVSACRNLAFYCGKQVTIASSSADLMVTLDAVKKSPQRVTLIWSKNTIINCLTDIWMIHMFSLDWALSFCVYYKSSEVKINYKVADILTYCWLTSSFADWCKMS